jgi:hypothetical protein
MKSARWLCGSLATSPAYVRQSLKAIEQSVDDCSHYLSALAGAFNAAQPIFVHADYEKFFWLCATTAPGWLQTVVLQSALSESDGAGLLFKTWAAITYNKEVEDGLLSHAKDEAYHSRVFLQLVKDVFPNYLKPEQADEIRSSLIVRNDVEKSGLHLPEDIAVDYLVQINLSEVRTLMNLHLIAPLLCTLAPSDRREIVEKRLRSLQTDELRHISYTAHLMEGWATSGDAELVADLFARNMGEFNTYTVMGTKRAIEEYGQGKFPSLLEL